MTEPVDYTSYATVLFMDSMVALEGKPLATLPWGEIDSTGPILILVVPQVMKEIDKRKRDGRLGKRAREFNRLIGRTAESGEPTRVSDGPPVVDIAFAVCDRVEWDKLDDLDPEEGDARVVAQILHTRGIPPVRKLVFSYDNNPIAMASRFCLPARKMPDHWLLEPEPSPAEKEINKLKARVSELSAIEPDLEATVTFGVAEPVQLYQVHSLSEEEQRRFVQVILEENPEYAQSALHFGIDHDYSYGERYKRYAEAVVPRHASTLHRRLETHYGQIPFKLHVSNNGHIQAENLAITMKAVGGTLNDRFVCYPIYGPAAPRPRNTLIHSIRDFQHYPPRPVGRHEMEFVVGPNRGSIIEAHCVDFRHGRTWDFNGIACLDSHSVSPLTLEVALTASNMRGSRVRTFEITHTAKSVAPGDLINLVERCGYHVAMPMAKRFQEALESKTHDWLEFVGGNDDEDEDVTEGFASSP